MHERGFVDTHQVSKRSQLLNALLAMPEVPKKSVTVVGGWIFVLDKLAALVEEYPEIAGTFDNLDEHGVKELIVDAWVTPAEAVEHWSVWPYPYVCHRVDDEGSEDDAITRPYVIRHVAFNADLPGLYATRDQRNQALGSLLLGQVIPGDGDMVFEEQPMTLRDNPATDDLPERPNLAAPAPLADDAAALATFRHLEGVAFQPGFGPVDQALFDKLRDLELDIATQTAHARADARQNASGLWAQTSALAISELNEPGTLLADHVVDAVRELRELYPELTGLNAATLYNYFDTFQKECHYQPDWQPARDDEFLFYLIGHGAGISMVPAETCEAGEIAGHAKLAGHDTSAAFALTRQWHAYRAAVRHKAYRVAAAMVFLNRYRMTTETS